MAKTALKDSIFEKRARNGGVTLVSVLLTCSILASLVIALHRTTQARTKVLSQIMAQHRMSVQTDSARAQFVGPILSAMTETSVTDVAFNGETWSSTYDGLDWDIRVQDSASVPGLFTSPPELLNLFFPGISVPDFTAIQNRAPIEALTVEQALWPHRHVFEDTKAVPLFASTRNRRINVSNIPIGLSRVSEQLPRSLKTKANPKEVRVLIGSSGKPEPER